jgi:hypothetical protein
VAETRSSTWDPVAVAVAETRSSTWDPVAVAVAETRSSTWDPVAVAVAETRSSTWDPGAVGAATSNCQVGQERVAWSSAYVLHVDVADVGAWRDAAAAAAEQHRFSGCT